MAKKLSRTRQWEQDHPNDVRGPRSPDAATAWRHRRGLDAAGDALREKYE
jgi:hypothetical protein